MKSTPSSGRVRRQLSFAHLPYSGKFFYLDIRNSSLKTRISRRVIDLGGQIETFLSKDVHLLITEKKEEKGTSKPGLQHFVGKEKLPLSRGQALLLHASKNQPTSHGQTTDILQNAANLGVKMETTSAFLRSSTKLLSKLKTEQKTENTDAMLGMAALSWDSKEKENACVVKVEDHDRLYKPLFKQFDDMPKVAYNENGCPFDVGVVLTKQSDNQSTKKKSVGGALRGGYCESCDHWYRCPLREHLSSSKHREFVSKLDNFRSLEEVSNDLPTFEKFLKQNKLSEGSTQSSSSQDVILNSSGKNSVGIKPNGLTMPVVNNIHIDPASEQNCKTKTADITNVSGNVAEHQASMTKNPTKYFMQRYTSGCVSLGENDLSGGDNNVRNSNDEVHSEFCTDFRLETKHPYLKVHCSVVKGAQDTVNYDTKYEEVKRALTDSVPCSKNNDAGISHNTVTSKAQCTGAFNPVADFSSSSCSFGDNGIRNAMAILQNISENTHNSHSRNSSDVFFKTSTGTNQNQRNDAVDVIDKSEISMESKLSCLNYDNLHTPTFEKFLGEKSSDLKDSFEMPVLFPVEQLSENKIGNAIMPMIDKHTPPRHNSYETRTYTCSIRQSGESENTVEPSDNKLVAKDFVSDVSNMPSSGVMNTEDQIDNRMTGETILHTPKCKLNSNISTEIKERVQTSGSTLTSVRNWLLPNEDKNSSIFSDFSTTKLNSTLVAPVEECAVALEDIEQLTECEQKQRNLVATWIQNQEFGASSVKDSESFESDNKALTSIKTPDKETQFQDNLSSRDITTPISEMYNELTDLSSIPTDSVISENAYKSLQADNFSETCDDNVNEMKENKIPTGTLHADTYVKTTSIVNAASSQGYHEAKIESFLTKQSSATCMPESINTGVNNVINGKMPVESNCSQEQTDISPYSNIPVQLDKPGIPEKSNTAENNISPGAENLENKSKRTNVRKKQIKAKVTKAKTGNSNKRNNSLQRSHTPASTTSHLSDSVYQNSALKSLTASNSYPVQQQMYSPISQSSDHFIHQQINCQPYNVNRFQDQNQTYQQSLYGCDQQVLNQGMGTQNHFNQEQNYYNTGLLPGQNFYSEQRHAFYQNHGGIQSQHYGFSGLSDLNSFVVHSPQQYQNPAFSYPQTSYSGVHANGLHLNAVNLNHFNQNSGQNFEDISQVDFLDNTQFSQSASHNGSVSSPGPWYHGQNSLISSQCGQQISHLHETGQIHTSVNQNLQKQVYPYDQQQSSHLSQFPQGFCSPVSQELCQNSHWYLSSPGCVPHNNVQSIESGTRTFETISLNDIAEDNSNTSSVSFSFGRLKRKADLELGNTDSTSSRQGQKVKFTQSGNANPKQASHLNSKTTSDKHRVYSPETFSVNTQSSVQIGANCTGNDIPPPVHHLKQSIAFSPVPGPSRQPYNSASIHDKQNCDSPSDGSYVSTSDGSYVSAKVGDTKIKISKMGMSTVGKKSDLRDYWNVKKTGDCRLVFRANKRKADYAERVGGSDNITPCLEQDFQNLPHAKRQKCAVY